MNSLCTTKYKSLLQMQQCLTQNFFSIVGFKLPAELNYTFSWIILLSGALIGHKTYLKKTLKNFFTSCKIRYFELGEIVLHCYSEIVT